MDRPVAVVGSLVALGLLAAVTARPLSAFPLTTCTLTVISRDSGGAEIGTAVGDGEGATRENPLLIDPKGSVEWTGTTGPSPLTRPSYHVEIFGVPTPLQGSTKDDSPRSGASGTVVMTDVLPFDIVGTVYVSGAIEVGGSPVCEGSGWIRLSGDPLSSPAGIAGAGLALIGIASILASAPRRHPFRGLLAGAIGGAGLALLSGVTGILPFDENTPLAAMVGMIVFGLLIGAIDFGSLFRRGAATRTAGTGGAGSRTPPAAEDLTGQKPAPSVPPIALAGGVPSPASADNRVPEAPRKDIDTIEKQPDPGLETIRAGVKGLDVDVKKAVEPIFQRAEGILATGPGTLTIEADVIGRILSHMPGSPSVALLDGEIKVSNPLLDVTATPIVTNGRLALDFDVSGRIAKATGELDGLLRFIDHLNRAVSDAGQRIASITVTPGGIVVTTETAGR